MRSRPTRNYLLVAAGVAGFLVGVLGNLVAAWIQQDVIQNIFSPLRLAMIAALTCAGILAMARWQSKMDQDISLSFSAKLAKAILEYIIMSDNRTTPELVDIFLSRKEPLLSSAQRTDIYDELEENNLIERKGNLIRATVAGKDFCKK